MEELSVAAELSTGNLPLLHKTEGPAVVDGFCADQNQCQKASCQKLAEMLFCCC